MHPQHLCGGLIFSRVSEFARVNVSQNTEWHVVNKQNTKRWNFQHGIGQHLWHNITLRCPAKHYSNPSKPFSNSPCFGSFYNLQEPSKPRPVLLCMEVALQNWIKQMWGICLAPSTHCGNDKINSNQTVFNRSALKRNQNKSWIWIWQHLRSSVPIEPYWLQKNCFCFLLRIRFSFRVILWMISVISTHSAEEWRSRRCFCIVSLHVQNEAGNFIVHFIFVSSLHRLNKGLNSEQPELDWFSWKQTGRK